MNFYYEYVLLYAGVLFIIIGTLLVIYLIASKKKNNFYEKIVNDETEITNLIEETEKFAKTSSYTVSKSVENDETQPMTANDETQLMPMNDETQLMDIESLTRLKSYTEMYSEKVQTSIPRKNEFSEIEQKVFNNKYTIEEEINGGGMSRVYTARNNQIGNKWIIKYIDNKTSALANEGEILKLLNHINLPKIVDIFYDENGIYIVESFIEGVSLDKVIMSQQELTQTMIIEFGEQLAQVLSYLHNLKPTPIIHCDLKPSNLMITHNNKIVLIDFGISKIEGVTDNKLSAATYRYAAPEQLKADIPDKYKRLIDARFGEEGKKYFKSTADKRTDVYGLGIILFEAATGQIPTALNKDIIKERVSDDLSRVILKCIELSPEKRYQSIDYVMNEFQKLRTQKLSMVKSIVVRRIAGAATAAAYILSAVTLVSGSYFYRLENGAEIIVDPNLITVSMEQSAEITFEKLFENDSTRELSYNDFSWKSGDSSIAQIDGLKIIGLNKGSTQITGTHRNKEIRIDVTVIEPIDGMVDVSLKYLDNAAIKRLYGTGESNCTDGNAENESEFISPGSIAMTDEGKIYICDADNIRVIDGENAVTIPPEPDYITPDFIVSSGNDAYMLSRVWEDTSDDKLKFGIYKINDGELEEIYIADAQSVRITDLYANDGKLYFIEENAIIETSTIKSIDLADMSIEVIEEIDYGFDVLCADDNYIYIAESQSGIVKRYNFESGSTESFIGIEEERGFIDSTAPSFYQPVKMKINNGFLYVLDFNVLRRVNISGNGSIDSKTIAGIPGMFYNEEIPDTRASEAKINYSPRTDFCFDSENNIIITDPVKSVVRKISL